MSTRIGISLKLLTSTSGRSTSTSISCKRCRQWSRSPLRSFSSTAAFDRYRFTTAYSFHGKPDSPSYTESNKSPHPTSEDQSPSSSSSSSSSTTSTSPDDHNFTRRDWRDHQAPQRLQQGLPSTHPAIEWRNMIWKKSGNENGPGHDWFFVENPNKDDDATVVVGVADGVGGWEESGVDPSVFAQSLMWYSRQQVFESGNVEPRKILEAAYANVLQEKGVIAGSSTACILSFDSESGSLNAANLGDSTFLLLRRISPPPPTPSPSPSSSPTTSPPPLTHSVVHMQASQTHFFNAPRQLAKMPKGANKQGALIDLPKDADRFETGLQDGDILVLATDGFSDNVWPKELEHLVALVQEHQSQQRLATTPEGEKIDQRSFEQMLADVCVNFARICSFKTNKESPFEVEARKYGHSDLKGGKVDDVTVVVVRVEHLE